MSFIMDLQGVNGQIELYSDKVIIKRKGVLAKMTQGLTKGDKSIYLNQISGIQMKLGSNIVNGYIQFTLPGGNEKSKGAFQATQDENSVMFKKADNDTAIELKEKIEELQQRKSTGSSFSAADELKKFKELLDEGVISQDEFDRKKRELLGI